MNRFETYQPINFEIPEYVQNPEAFAKILAGQDALFEQKQKEKESMLSAGDKLAQSLKYAPDESYKKIYDQTLSDYRNAQDEVETAYKTKGIAAGEAALRKYKKTLSDDFTNGRASKLMSSAAQWEDMKKRVTEMYKDEPQAAYYYLYGAGKSEWFKPYEEGKDANIGQPSLLQSMKDADLTKSIVETLKNVKPDVQTLLSYLPVDAPEWLINGVKTFSDPYHYIMDESVRQYVDTDRLMSGVLGNLSPDVLEAMELKGRIKGQKGWGDMKNLVSSYATDADGNVVELKTPDEIKEAKKNKDLVVRTIFNPSNPYGNQFNNLIDASGMDTVKHDRKIIENGLGRMEDMAIKKQQMAQQAQQDKINNYWKEKNYNLEVDKLDEEKKKNATLNIGTPADVSFGLVPWAKIGDDGKPVVNKGTVNQFRTTSEKSLKEIDEQLKDSNLAPEQIKALKSKKEYLQSELANLKLTEEEFRSNPSKFGYVGSADAEKKLKESGYYDTMSLKINGNMTQMKVSDLLKRDDLVVKKDGIYKRGTKQNVRGDITESDTKIGIIGDKQYQTYLSAQQASKLYKSNIENMDKSFEEYLQKGMAGNTPISYTNPSTNEKWNKSFSNSVPFSVATLPPKVKVVYNGKEYSSAGLARKMADDAGHTDWIVDKIEGDKNNPSSATYYLDGHQTKYSVNSAVTVHYHTPDGKKFEMKYPVSVPSSDSEGNPNYIIDALQNELNSSTTKAGLLMSRALKTPTELYNTSKVRIHSTADGKFMVTDKVNNTVQEIPQASAFKMLETNLDHELHQQLKAK